MFCSQCGKENLDGARFCESCGASLDAVQTPSADGAANPFAVGAQTTNASFLGGAAPVVPSGPFSAYKMVISKYFDVSGRASRTEIWYWFLCNFMILILLFGCLLVSAVLSDASSSDGWGVFSFAVLAVIIIYFLFALVPGIAVNIRRIHDFNHSGWLFLLVLIPYAGSLASLVFSLIPGTQGPNQYGPQPAKRREE